MSKPITRFTPHALILTERSVPEPMFVAAVIGVERLLRVDLDAGAPPLTFAGQALRAVRAVRRRLAEWRSDQLPAFGRPTGRPAWWSTTARTARTWPGNRGQSSRWHSRWVASS
jgi:hypothetical protein